MKLSKKSRMVVIVISAVIILLAILWASFGYWLKYLQPYRGDIKYYSDGSYSKFGFGFSRYGKISSDYLPKYDELAEDALDVQFMYCGGAGYTKTVDVIVAAKYDQETYIQKQQELLQMGTDFGADYHIGEIESRHHRLIDEGRMFNGDYVYYVITCCDKDRSVTYSVMFDHSAHKDMGKLSTHSHPYHNFFRDFHTECIPS